MKANFLNCITRPHLYRGFCAVLRYSVQKGAVVKTELFYADTCEQAEEKALARLDELNQEPATC